MTSITNIPHIKSDVGLAPLVLGETVHVRAVKIDVAPHAKNLLENSASVMSVFVGDHLFEPEMRYHLRELMARELCRAIEKGREVGYAQAMSDVRELINWRPR